MSAPILYYTPGTCALAAMVVPEWIGEPYELRRVSSAARGRPTYRAVNPRGLVPALVLEGDVLVENGAILAALADRHPTQSLLPVAPSRARDVANQLLSYFASAFHVSFYPYFHPQRFVRDRALAAHVKESSIDNIRAQLDTMNAHLDGNRFVLGTDRTVLDPYLYAMTRWAKPLVSLDAEYPHLADHVHAMEADETIAFALAVEKHGAPEAKSPSGALRVHHELDESITSA